MNKVNLIPLAIIDLNLKYAREMGPDLVRHYIVPAGFIMLTGADPKQLVIEYILAEEPDAEIQFTDRPETKIAEPSIPVGPLRVTDATEQVLAGHPQIKESLEKMKGTNLTLQEDVYDRKVDRYLDMVQDFCRSVKYKLLYRFETLDFGNGHSREFYFDGETPMFFMPVKRRARRRLTPCTYLSYTYNDDSEAQAYDALALDLFLLDQRGLIMGNLSMPSTLHLADSTGIGPLPKALFCFLYVDIEKLAKQLGKKLSEMPSTPLSLIEIKSEVLEGGIGPFIGKKREIQIEEVIVSGAMSEVGRQAHIRDYLMSRPAINEMAANQREALSKVEIVKSSEHILTKGTRADGSGRTTALNVNIEVKKKE